MCTSNKYIPVGCEIIDIIKHTDIEWTFRAKTNTEKVKPGQFYEISIPMHGESPISVSGIGDNYVDFTIRNVGKVTGNIFKYDIGDTLLLRGPYVYANPNEFKSFELIVGFKSLKDILFKKDLEKWSEKLKITVTLDSADDDYKGNVGLVTKYIPNISITDLDNVSAVVVGPPMMMKFSIIELQKLNISDENIWVSYERKMHCGIGKCGHCKMDSTYICIDGPVFNYKFAKNLAD